MSARKTILSYILLTFLGLVSLFWFPFEEAEPNLFQQQEEISLIKDGEVYQLVLCFDKPTIKALDFFNHFKKKNILGWNCLNSIFKAQSLVFINHSLQNSYLGYYRVLLLSILPS
ncbi:MAG: hypothetical protein KJO29_01020 [Bacteroidia bacterium]|nr:hypothetical protein [Bacteroidia bacterium]